MMPPRTLSKIRQLDPLAAIQALVRLGPEENVLRFLAHYLGHADPQVRIEAVRALGEMGPISVGYLAAPLADVEPAVRRETAATLGKIGPPAAPAVAELTATLKDRDLKVRTAVTVALGQIGPAAVPAIEELIRVLRGPFLILCRLAAQALSRIGTASVPALVETLLTGDNYSRREAAWALGELGPSAVEPASVERWRDSIPLVPRAVPCGREAVPHATVPIFLGATVPVERPTPMPGRTRRVGQALPDATTALAEALRDADAKVRDAARRSLERIRGRR